MFILCPSCENPEKNIWVTVTRDRVSHTGRFACTETRYSVDDIEMFCDCELDESLTEKIIEEAIEASLEEYE